MCLRASLGKSTPHRRHNSLCNQLTQRCRVLPYITRQTAGFYRRCGRSELSLRRDARVHTSGTRSGGDTCTHGNTVAPTSPCSPSPWVERLIYGRHHRIDAREVPCYLFSHIEPGSADCWFRLMVRCRERERAHAYLFVCTYQ